MKTPELIRKQRIGYRIAGPDGPVDFRPRWQGDIRPWRTRGVGATTRYRPDECRAVRRSK